MQLDEIREQAYARAGIAESNANVPVPVMDRFINAALRKTNTRFDPFWLETSGTVTTAAGTYAYPLSGLPNFHRLSRVQDEGFSVLQSLGKQELPRFLSLNRHRPVAYTVEEQTLKLAPIPDAAYTLTVIYFRLEDPLLDNADSPLLPDQYADWLICEAGILAATKERDIEMLTILRQERDEWVKNIRDDIRQMRAFPRVRTRGSRL